MKGKSKILSDPRLKRYRYDQRSKDYFNTVLTLFLVTVFTIFAIRPSITTAFKLKKSIKEYNEIDQTLAKKIVTLKKVRTVYRDIRPDLKLLDSAIPSEKNEGDILKYLNHLSAKNQVQTSVVQFKNENSTTNTGTKDDKDLKTLNIVMSVTGGYPQIKYFLKDLNNTLRIIEIEKVSFRPSSHEGMLGRVDAIIRAKAYYEETNDLKGN